ncbi:branched-chain amino acid ABC transporter permease [Haloferax mediterranei ATCC 33500]|uniref:Branched-chain amino acid ABC transporter permease n=1 Tax=Haloferax mediterranei (strain ATCC 33500 / DSM 1411 / JCM 8866 / NBRC 14739 / NCIMB 2177 / R-4) TaxID=523841 RepID=I3R6R8_HALMT|nr:AzlC family ABC transporter permease [Haloferax mediterranei]AFK19928.1 branched-chain amino acids ABC transporter permease,azaleucine resistance protein [Haloferax mediterranei ATCC 33500]AHZ23306.1 branched-chain amino acid ABC transporter permease [Haloferax mediterranei ATCC 33500]ELZ99472.1 branched-chain amino acids ABC transporter permease,azaleucine resistance protein [Haloferax mediterranei ATCC 33500]MDX5987321.1 AzlC family ABC transporter permease [Haloferax mediterranei ATCC 335
MPTLPSDFLDGVRDAAPLHLGIAPFGLVAGVAAVEQGLSIFHAIGFSSVVFAGASQLAMIELLGADAPLAIVVGTAVVVNLRMLMYSASIAPHFRDFAARSKAVSSYLLTDQAYALSIARYGRDGETDRFAYYFGVAASLWVVWQFATIAGALLGTGLPPEWGFEFAAPLVFLALLVPALKNRAAAASGLTGGVVAVAVVVAGVPFHLDIIVAAVVGVLAGLAVESFGGEL